MMPVTVSVSVQSRKRRSQDILPHAIVKFPVETEELPKANIIARKAINNLLQVCFKLINLRQKICKNETF